MQGLPVLLMGFITTLTKIKRDSDEDKKRPDITHIRKTYHVYGNSDVGITSMTKVRTVLMRLLGLYYCINALMTKE